MKTLKVIAAVLVIVSALNWGLVALAHFDLVAALLGMSFGQTSVLSSLVYGLVGLSGLLPVGGAAGRGPKRIVE